MSEVTAICPCLWTAYSSSRFANQSFPDKLIFGNYYNTEISDCVREHGYAKFDFSPVAAIPLTRIKTVSLRFTVISGWSFANAGIELARVMKQATIDLNWIQYAPNKAWTAPGGLFYGADITQIIAPGSQSNFAPGDRLFTLQPSEVLALRNGSSVVCYRVPQAATNPSNGVRAELGSLFFEVVYETERAGTVTLF